MSRRPSMIRKRKIGETARSLVRESRLEARRGLALQPTDGLTRQDDARFAAENLE